MTELSQPPTLEADGWFVNLGPLSSESFIGHLVGLVYPKALSHVLSNRNSFFAFVHFTRAQTTGYAFSPLVRNCLELLVHLPDSHRTVTELSKKESNCKHERNDLLESEVWNDNSLKWTSKTLRTYTIGVCNCHQSTISSIWNLIPDKHYHLYYTNQRWLWADNGR